MSNSPASRYATSARNGLTPREIEAGALLKSAARLQAAAANYYPGSTEYDAALTHNRRLWSILATSVSAPASPLPDPLKAQILALANFIFNRSIIATGAPAAQKLKSLIDINLELAAGLRGQNESVAT